MKLYHFLPLAIALVSSQAFAFPAYSAYLRCTSENSFSSIPFSDSEADGFGFDEGAQIVLNKQILSAAVLPTFKTKKMGVGPSLFTIQSTETGDKRKLGYIVRTKIDGERKPLSNLDPADDVGVEIFNHNGKSLGTENASCEIVRKDDDQN